MSAPTLSILSYNIRRSPDVWTLLSNHTLLRTLDILLLQEPPPLAVVLPDWVRLDSPPGRRARSVALVRQKWAQSSYAQVAVASSDVVALDLRTGTAGEASVRVIGVYNPHQGDPEPTERGKSAREVLPPILESTPPGSLLVVAGNFNLHHPECRVGPRVRTPRRGVRRCGTGATHLCAARPRPPPRSLDADVQVSASGGRRRPVGDTRPRTW